VTRVPGRLTRVPHPVPRVLARHPRRPAPAGWAGPQRHGAGPGPPRRHRAGSCPRGCRYQVPGL